MWILWPFEARKTLQEQGTSGKPVNVNSFLKFNSG